MNKSSLNIIHGRKSKPNHEVMVLRSRIQDQKPTTAEAAVKRYAAAYKRWVRKYNAKLDEGQSAPNPGQSAPNPGQSAPNPGQSVPMRKQPLRTTHINTFMLILGHYRNHIEKVAMGFKQIDAPFRLAATTLASGAIDSEGKPLTDVGGQQMHYATAWRHIARLKEAGLIHSHSRDARSGTMTLILNAAVIGATIFCEPRFIEATTRQCTFLSPLVSATHPDEPKSWFSIAKCDTSREPDTLKRKLANRSLACANGHIENYPKRVDKLKTIPTGTIEQSKKIVSQKALAFALIVLYKNKFFSEKVKNEALGWIESFFDDCATKKELHQRYLTFCTRICLRQHYIDRTGAGQMNPSIYFDPEIPNHFAYTKIMLDKQLNLERKYPEYVNRYKKLAYELNRYFELYDTRRTWALEQAEHNLGKIKGDRGYFLAKFSEIITAFISEFLYKRTG